MYCSKSGALAVPGAGAAGPGGGGAAEGRAELDGCPEVAGALAMPGAGAAEPGGGDAAGGPAEVDGSGHGSSLGFGTSDIVVALPPHWLGESWVKVG